MVRRDKKRSSLQYAAESALCIALAIVFSQIKLFHLPQGGSVTLEIVPLIVLARRWGVCRGVMAGAVTGILRMILGGYVVHPLQGALDYPLAYAALGLTAIGNRSWLGVLIGGVARIVCHVASGVIFFASYAPEGLNPLVYSLAYNAGFMSVNIALALILVPLILSRLDRLNI